MESIEHVIYYNKCCYKLEYTGSVYFKKRNPNLYL